MATGLDHILVERDGPLTIITIDRPEARNALNAAASQELADAFDAFEADDGQWVAIITGAGDKAFCAGHDLKQQAEGGGLVTPSSGFGGITARFALTKPVIAAVNGAAMGGGFEMVLACDLAVAVRGAVFALPEPRVGLAALAGGTARLPRDIGLKRAMGMLLTGRTVSADEALAMGFINEVVADDALAAARNLAAQVLACSPLSIRATKEAVLRSLAVPLPEFIQHQMELPQMMRMLASSDAREGPKAFAEKRSPKWSGS